MTIRNLGTKSMRLCLYQPDIPQNTGAIMRLGACFGAAIDIIEPCGFIFDERRMRRSGMDYIDLVSVKRWPNWQDYLAAQHGRLILLTTKGATRLPDFSFHDDDILVFGRESAGVPEDVAQSCTERLKIPMREGLRSLNVAQSAAMALGEALRQTESFPP